MDMLLHEDLTYEIIGAAREVHYQLDPGFLESVYEDALCYELELRKLMFERQVDLDVHYKETEEKRASYPCSSVSFRGE